ncbi:MAG: type II/IV secretion system protein [Epsilonproteobacteria bacterium]|nr:type II/IV secretion system protein [Campylobacterota bacterium]
MATGNTGDVHIITSPETTLKHGIVNNPTVDLVDEILYNAIEQNASDVHFQPNQNHLTIRYRIDGILYDQQIVTGQQKNALLSRIKIFAGLDIAEQRLPQDGKFRVRLSSNQEFSTPIANDVIDLRISTFPSIHGEKLVIRVLDRSYHLKNLDELGLNKSMHNYILNLLTLPHGLVLVTGPTGSGKSTTLHAMLSKLNTSEKNIITMEDPVEYELAGITQSQVNTRAGFSFENGLRAMLRQDPDIIMIGEIRDKPTVQMAIEASLTGHLVVSTLHTNDTTGAITRLLEMGLEPFLLTSSLVCVLAQRLVRKLCSFCKQKKSISKEEQLFLQKHDKNLTATFFPKGCSHCFGRGYSGRIGIFELLPISPELRTLIMNNPSHNHLTAYIQNQNIALLLSDGLEKVEQGVISLHELLHIIVQS